MSPSEDTPDISVRPAREAGWEDVQRVFGSRGDPWRCQCQRYRMAPGESWASVGVDELRLRLREQTHLDGLDGPGGLDGAGDLDRLDPPGGLDPSGGLDGSEDLEGPGGLVAYVGDEPAGWCAVAPRTAYPRLLRNTRVPWDGRDEDKADAGVWAVTCFVTRVGFRRRGVSRALAQAAVAAARAGGAYAVEGYPMETPEQGTLPSELHVGVRSVFADAGFSEVSHPTSRRVVMRREV